MTALLRHTAIGCKSFRIRASQILITAAVVFVAGCAGLPPRVAAPTSEAYATPGSTFLGKVSASAVSDPMMSGFQLMPVATNAYEARIALAQLAEHAIDVQYYVLAEDETGKFLLKALVAAARRGVRVRVLIDDSYTVGEDQLLADFAANPNVEVRLFNPFPAARGSLLTRYLATADDFRRVDHRMHNKLFVVDGAIAVAGGRNIADEYFMRSTSDNFVDLDVLAAGNVVRELSGIFDLYWNSRFAFPLAEIVSPDPDPIAAARRFDVTTAEAHGPPADLRVPARLSRYVGTPEDLKAGNLHLEIAEAHAFADPVEKAAGANEDSRAGTVRATVAAAMAQAQSDVFVASPYFVPGVKGLETMKGLRSRGVTLRLVTNSLASTDEPIVHGAYMRSRLPMLEMGVQIYELSPSLAQTQAKLGRFGSSLGRLHAKVAVIDHRRLFVGSMNLDERSQRKNTELGILIESPQLAQEFETLMDFSSSSYRLQLGPDSQSIEWTTDQALHQTVLHHDPETTWWLRTETEILSYVIPSAEL